MNPIAERLISYRAFDENGELLGTADVQLPDLEYLSDTIKGAGILGEIDTPIFGHLAQMSMTINWRTLSKPAIFLARPGVHQLEFRSATQIQNAGTGEIDISSTKVTVRCMPKKVSLGKMDVGTASDTNNEFQVTYIKIVQDGEVTAEIDKLNYICIINGVDHMAKVREALGL